MMANREDLIRMKITAHMLLFDNIENDKEFNARQKFIRIICEMELILKDMYEHFSGMQKVRVFGDLLNICVFDHEPIDKEHKLVSIQICYRRFTPFANISCGRRRMSLCVDDDKLRASLIDWWEPMGTFDYDQEALVIQKEFVKLLNKYGIKREVWR
jgi:hypothetical protein